MLQLWWQIRVNESMFLRISQIIEALEPIQRGDYFFEFMVSLDSNPTKKMVFQDIECHLADLHEDQWKLLFPNVVEKFRNEQADRGWQQAINTLYEAIAYSFLKRHGFSEIQFLPRQLSRRTPDLLAWREGLKFAIEVKNINKSDAQIEAEKNMTVQSMGLPLDEKFFAKLHTTLKSAAEQLAFQPSDKKVIFLFLAFDDSSNEYVMEYLSQITSWLQKHDMVADLYFIHCHPAHYFASSVSKPPHLIVWSRDNGGLVEMA